MTWQDELNGDALSWLLEPDEPGVRYLALRDLLDRQPDDPELLAAREKAHREGPIATVLDQMDEAGYWVKPGSGYNPKYRSGVWSLILLRQLGAAVEMDPRIGQACRYLLDHAVTPYGQISTSGTPGSTIDCLQGNMLAALVGMGYDDPRLAQAYDWMARSVTGEGIAPQEEKDNPVRYYAYKSGPDFACGVNYGDPCAWGAVKVMLAFAELPRERWRPQVEQAVQRGVDFLLGVDPATALYPSGPTTGKPNRAWWKFGFPVFYVTDLLQNAEALVRLGYGADPRLANALDFIRGKQDATGRWPLEYDYAGKSWVDFGPKRKPNKWVTLRAARVLRLAAPA